MSKIICFFLISMMMATASADVIKSSDDGFIVQHRFTTGKVKSYVFRAMTDDVGKWWDSDHSFSSDAGNMLINEACFCERWDSNLVRHLDTAIWIENAKVVMEGGLGPLKELGLSGTMIWSLTANEGGRTTVSWKYHVYGFSETGMSDLAAAVDGVLKAQIDRLAAFLAEESDTQ